MHQARGVVRSQADNEIGAKRIQYDEKENSPNLGDQNGEGSGTEGSGVIGRLFSPVLNYFNGEEGEDGEGEEGKRLNFNNEVRKASVSARSQKNSASVCIATTTMRRYTTM